MVKLKSLHATSEAAETAFYEALESGDLDALMEVWSDDDEIVCIHPGGPRLVGHRAIATSWREILANGPISVRPNEPQIMTASLVAVHTAVSRVTAHVRIEGSRAPQAVAANVLVTHVFFKGAQGWRMVLHHASVTPEDTDPMPMPPSGTLH
jgi:ketosteroid isomerase-like protein